MENVNNAAPRKTSKRKVVLAVMLSLVLVIALGYTGLCVYVGVSDTVLPNVAVQGVDVSGMTLDEMTKALQNKVKSDYADVEYTLISGESSVVVDGSLVDTDIKTAAEQAYNVGRGETFFKRGAVILAQLTGKEQSFGYKVWLSQEGEHAVDQAVDQLCKSENVDLAETVWGVEGNTLVIQKGVTGITLDREYALPLVKAAVVGCSSQTFEVPRTLSDPRKLDLQGIYDTIYVEPVNSYMDTDHKVVAHVVGISFDIAQVQAQFDQLAEAGTMSVDLTLTDPELTEQKFRKLLFADDLSTYTTSIGGTENRLNNVVVATKALDEVILLPGEVFSYNQTLGPRTEARGYLPAPAYIGGKTVDDVGGGICQNSCTLYIAALKADLEIVHRSNHMFRVGYVPDGLDATVAWNAVDFKFRNNTDYPIRIQASVKNRKMTITLEGTKVNDNYVKLTTETLSTTPYEIKYKEDANVARGTTVVETTPYTGAKVEAYRLVYDGNGNLISKTLESVSTYRKRDKVILYNPADGHPDTWVDGKPATGTDAGADAGAGDQTTDTAPTA